MKQHNTYATSPTYLLRTIAKNRGLIISLIKRDVADRYRGSAMGMLWALLNPILMLAVYTFVFSIVFKARWTSNSDSQTEFALILFSGLMLFNIFSECINRAPNLITQNANYVKKIVFPLEILPIVTIGSAIFHFVISLSVWLAFYIIFFGTPNLSTLQLPLIVFPLLLMTLGLSWILASLGAYLRDTAQVTGIITTIFLFTTPIFFPLESLPEEFRNLIKINPLTVAIEQGRNTMVWGKSIDWSDWAINTGISLAVLFFGFFWFQKTRKGFADVL